MRRLLMGVALVCGTVALLVLGFAPESVASVHSHGVGDGESHGHGSNSSHHRQFRDWHGGFDVIDVLIWGSFSQEEPRGPRDDGWDSRFSRGTWLLLGSGEMSGSGDDWKADYSPENEEDCHCALLRFLDRGRFLLRVDGFRFEVEHAVRENHHRGKWHHHGNFAGHFIGHWFKGHGDREDCDEDPPAVPEPSTALLIGLGLIGIGLRRGRSGGG